MNPGRKNQRVLFVTGTGTGVGKTVLSLCLLRFLKEIGERAIGLKPFCSGDREDARRLQQESAGNPSIDRVNPFHCRVPVAPGALKNPGYKAPTLREIMAAIRGAARTYDWVIIEGIGGILVPVTPRLLVVDLIEQLGCEVLVVSANELGTINTTLLTIRELQRRKIHPAHLVYAEKSKKDPSSTTNPKVIGQVIGNKKFQTIPALEIWPVLSPKSDRQEKFFKKTLATLLGIVNVWPRCCDAQRKQKRVRSRQRGRAMVLGLTL